MDAARIAALAQAEQDRDRQAAERLERGQRAWSDLQSAFILVFEARRWGHWIKVVRQFCQLAVETGKRGNVDAEQGALERIPKAEAQAAAAIIGLAKADDAAAYRAAVLRLLVAMGGRMPRNGVRKCILGRCQDILNGAPIEYGPPRPPTTNWSAPERRPEEKRPTEPAKPEYRGDGLIVGLGSPIRLFGNEVNVIEALIEKGPLELQAMKDHSGVPNANAVLKKITVKHPQLEPFIYLPGAKAKGGYRVSIALAAKATETIPPQ